MDDREIIKDFLRKGDYPEARLRFDELKFGWEAEPENKGFRAAPKIDEQWFTEQVLSILIIPSLENEKMITARSVYEKHRQTLNEFERKQFDKSWKLLTKQAPKKRSEEESHDKKLWPWPWWVTTIGAIGVGLVIVGIYSVYPKSNTQITEVAQGKRDEPTQMEVYVPMSTTWKNTGFFVKTGQVLQITASGRGIWKNLARDNPNAQPRPREECGPDGTPADYDGYYSNIGTYQCDSANKGALIGKIGQNGIPFFVGSNLKKTMDQNEVLYLGINDQKPELGTDSWLDNSGGFAAQIKVEDTTVSSSTSFETRQSSTIDQGNGRYIVTINPKEKYDTSIIVPAGSTVNAYAIEGRVLYDPLKPIVGPKGTTQLAAVFPEPYDFPVQDAGVGAVVMEVVDVKNPKAPGIKHVLGNALPTYPIIFGAANFKGKIITYVNDRWYALSDNEGYFVIAFEVRR